MLHLKDITDIRHVPASATSYYRINGLNAINIHIESARNANQLQVSQHVKLQIEKLERQLPAGFSLIKNYDATSFLKEELEKIAWRSLLSLSILLLFVWLVSRSLKYLFIILMALTANLGIAALCYYVLGLELHLYSLAGITVSLGLVIDNSIVMTDHLKYQGNKRVFIALLAATLTTIGALVVIFFMSESQQIFSQGFCLGDDDKSRRFSGCSLVANSSPDGKNGFCKTKEEPVFLHTQTNCPFFRILQAIQPNFYSFPDAGYSADGTLIWLTCVFVTG